jgi:membrane-bound lytic murein transglycosylase B
VKVRLVPVALVALAALVAAAAPARAQSGATTGSDAGSSTSTTTGASTAPVTPADTSPILLAEAPVAITDDPRVAPQLAAVALDSDDYRKATRAYQDTDGRRRAAITRREDAVVRHDRALADLALIAQVRPQVEGELNAATRREAKAQRLLDQSRADFATYAIGAYVAGGRGGSVGESLQVKGSNEFGQQKVLLNTVERHALAQQARYSGEQQAEADHVARAGAELDELDRRTQVAQTQRDTAATDREQAGAEQERLALELERRRRDVADTRLAAGVPGLDFPFVVLNAYVRAANAMAVEMPSCGIRWSALAGIGRTESNHGTFGGSTVDANGHLSKPINGIDLNGQSNTAVVTTGDGAIDRAQGPMQFITGTWKRWGRDGDGDGEADIQNFYDATLGAAVYLCQKGPGLDADDGLRRGYYSYNADNSYVNIVLGRTHNYERVRFPPVPPAR